MKVLVKTFGCRVNQADTQELLQFLSSLGITPVEKGIPDLVIINGCVVTERAARDVVKEARKLAKKHSSAHIIITGCPAYLATRIRQSLPPRIRTMPLEELKSLFTARAQPEDKPSGLHYRTRPLLKVQEGCDRMCAFCIVPYVRGTPRSKPLERVIEEAQKFEAEGAKEIVVTGTHLALYGRDRGWNNGLERLLEALLSNTHSVHFRLSSLDPDEITPGLLDLASSTRRICRHFHIPLQSGS